MFIVKVTDVELDQISASEFPYALYVPMGCQPSDYFQGQQLQVQSPAGHIHCRIHEIEFCNVSGKHFIIWINSPRSTRRAYQASVIDMYMREGTIV